jgi:nickel-dependent lactate racemase
VPADEALVLREVLAQPIGTPRLRQLAQAGQKVAIVISDLTRPCPSERLLPAVLDELTAACVPDEDITVIAALGLHRPMTEPELTAAAGEGVYRRVRVVNHDPSDTLPLGVTSAGTPVELFRPLVEADLRVCVGNLEFHYFAGFSGGAKAILPGCAAQATINANHAMMVEAGARAGQIAGNPVRRDIEEGAAMLGVDFILNVVVDEQHRITGAVAGDVTVAHRRGCELIRQRGTIPIPRLADIVVASAGGFPKDVNLYQAQKALENAAYAVRPGGALVLIAECREGFGSQVFESWMREANSPDEILERIKQRFVIGGHKAAAIAAVLKRAHVCLVSAMPPEVVRACGLLPFDDAEQALRWALQQLGDAASVLALPDAGSSLPAVTG